MGWFNALLVSYNGYFQLLPGLAASLALLAPLRYAPLVMNLTGIAFQALPVTLLLSRRCSNWGPLSLRAFMSVFYVALPNTMELDASATNVQWHLSLAACILILAGRPDLKWLPLDIAILVLSGLTGPFSIFLLPVAVIFWWLRRDSVRLVPIAALVATAAAQLSAIVQTGSATRSKAGLGATPALFAEIVARRVFLGALLGQNTSVNYSHLVFGLLTLLFGAVVIYSLLKMPLELKLFLSFTMLVFAASLKNPMVSTTVPQWPVLRDGPGLRYWLFPMLGFVWGLLWCAAAKNNSVIRLAAFCGLLRMVVGIMHDWSYPAYPNLQFQEHASQFAAAAPGTVMNIPICPPGWVLSLTKHPSCKNPPFGRIDLPTPNSLLLGSTPVAGWVLGSSPIQQVAVSIDHTLVQLLKPSLPRPDIDKAYVHYDSRDKGWTTIVDMSNVSPGKHEIEARARDANGCELDFAVVPVERGK